MVQLQLPFAAVFQRIGWPRVGSPLEPITFVRHRRARRYLLRVQQDGCLRVTIPQGGSRREADRFVRQHAAWVVEQRARLPGPSPLSETERLLLRARAKVELPARLIELAEALGLRVRKVSIRDQRTRWGSCAADGHICLNWRLVLMPDWVRDYVLTHELMHLRRLDHSPGYWQLVEAACPEYREARRWLRAHGPSLR